jgi:hypothetical protein
MLSDLLTSKPPILHISSLKIKLKKMSPANCIVARAGGGGLVEYNLILKFIASPKKWTLRRPWSAAFPYEFRVDISEKVEDCISMISISN